MSTSANEPEWSEIKAEIEKELSEANGFHAALTLGGDGNHRFKAGDDWFDVYPEARHYRVNDGKLSNPAVFKVLPGLVRAAGSAARKKHERKRSSVHTAPDDTLKAAPRNDDGDFTKSIEEVRTKSVRWLWKNRIPFGKITMIDGDPGLAKSAITMDIAARVSSGRPMPGEEPSGEKPAGVIIINFEDDEDDTLKPRLEACGANMSNIRILDTVKIEGSKEERLFNLLDDLGALDSDIKKHNVKLVVIDPLMASLGDSKRIDSHKDQDIRAGLVPLKTMCAKLGVAVIMVRHLTKTGGRNAVYRGGGSIGIGGQARVGMIVGKDPGGGDHLLLAIYKNNNAPEMPPVAFRKMMVSVTLDEEDKNGNKVVSEIIKIEWIGLSDETTQTIIDAEVTRRGVGGTKQRIIDVMKKHCGDDGILPFGVWERLDKQRNAPPVSREAIRQAMRRMHDEGLLEKNEHGRYLLPQSESNVVPFERQG